MYLSVRDCLSAQKGFPPNSVGKESACNTSDPGSVPGSQRSPGNGNAALSSILAWRIPWTEKPGRLQFMIARVRHDLATKPLPPTAQKEKLGNCKAKTLIIQQIQTIAKIKVAK